MRWLWRSPRVAFHHLRGHVVAVRPVAGRLPGVPYCLTCATAGRPLVELRVLERTCTACPSQWDATTADGRQLYVRYRHGRLTVDRVPGPDWWRTGAPVEQLFCYQTTDADDADDGWMSDEEMLHLTGMVLA